jgi:8-oxo-dGTP diphosphatase
MTDSAARHIRVVAAVVQQGDRYLITQRRPTALLPLMWEFPGGRVEPNESDSEALRREVFHRLQVTVEVGQLMSYVCHKYDKYVVDLHLYQCTIRSGEICNANVNNHAWVKSDEFDQYLFTPADESSVAELLGIDSTRA